MIGGATRPTRTVSAPHGATLEYLPVGDGSPTTLFLPGLGGGIADTRPLGGAVGGRRVFANLRGHGGSSTPAGRWTWADLAADAAAVADAVGATRAVGTSLGAGALCRLLAGAPDRFDRLVFFLPAMLDRSEIGGVRPRLAALVDAAAAGDRRAVADLVGTDVPAGHRDTPAAEAFVAQRVDTVLSLGAHLAGLPDRPPVPDVAALAAVRAPALVLCCDGDPAHPVEVAEALAAALPAATLHRYPEPGVLWTHRADLRGRISSFLNG